MFSTLILQNITNLGYFVAATTPYNEAFDVCKQRLQSHLGYLRYRVKIYNKR